MDQTTTGLLNTCGPSTFFRADIVAPQPALSFRPLPLRPRDEFRCSFTNFFRNGQAAQHSSDFFFSPHPLESPYRRGCPLTLQPLFHKQMMLRLGRDLRKMGNTKHLMECPDLAQSSSHGCSNRPADSRIDFVKYQNRNLVLLG